MSDLNYFIKYIKLDDEKRILISIQNQFESHLQDKQNRKMIKDSLSSILNDDFKLLEIGKNICRVTVTEGKENESKQKIEQELIKGLDMAMNFINQMQNKDNQ